MVGQTISHYTILEKLGQGGMGVVYKARDTQLDRDVALKFLPQDLAVTDEERARFIREAKAASALDHPNICTIYETGETPAGQMFIVMGYYKGTTLNQRLEKGRLELAETISIAIQAAEGLQAAHENRIVHRDIKSSNIMVTDKGLVKILDFGLAHQSGASKLTKTGSTLGTASYMSPEQARGESLDHRSDVWSLGVVLYEMVTGQLPFRGGHEMAILYSVVNEEPRPVQELVPDAPAELVHIIGRALEKDPAERYQSASDLLIDLRRLKKDTSRTGFSPVGTATGRVAILRRAYSIIAGTGVLLILAAAGYYFFLRNGPGLNVNFIQRTIDVPFQKGIRAAISPSGKWIVFAALDANQKADLYVVGTTGGVPKRITNDSVALPNTRQNLNNATLDPQISPDDQEIIYSRIPPHGSPELCRVPLVGGQVMKLGEGMFGKWSRDGKRIGYIKYPQFSESRGAEFWTMQPDGKDNRREFIDTVGMIQDEGPTTTMVFHFDWSPDGRSVAWLRRTNGLWCEIICRDLSAGTESTILSDSTVKTSLSWLTSGIIVYQSSGDDGAHLWAIPEDGGKPLQVTRGTGKEDFPTTSVDGSLLLFNGSRVSRELWIGRLDGSDPERVASIEGSCFWWPNYSPARKEIVFPKSMLGLTSYNLSVINRDGSNERWITRGHIATASPLWSPSGKLISFESRNMFEPFDSARLYVINPSTMEAPRLISGPFQYSAHWLSDSVLALFHRTGRSTRDSRSMKVGLDGSPPVQVAADSIVALVVGDGKYIEFYNDRANAIPGVDSIVAIEQWDGNGGKNARKFERNVPDGWNMTMQQGRSRFELWWDPVKGDLWKIWFPDGLKEKVLSSVDALKGCDKLSMSWDENWYTFFSWPTNTSSITLIENLFIQ